MYILLWSISFAFFSQPCIIRPYPPRSVVGRIYYRQRVCGVENSRNRCKQTSHSVVVAFVAHFALPITTLPDQPTTASKNARWCWLLVGTKAWNRLLALLAIASQRWSDWRKKMCAEGDSSLIDCTHLVTLVTVAIIRCFPRGSGGNRQCSGNLIAIIINRLSSFFGANDKFAQSC